MAAATSASRCVCQPELPSICRADPLNTVELQLILPQPWRFADCYGIISSPDVTRKSAFKTHRSWCATRRASRFLLTTRSEAPRPPTHPTALSLSAGPLPIEF
jgi:hypothetical protein